MSASLHHFSQKFYPLNYEYGKLAKTLDVVLLTGAAYYYLLFRVGLEPWHRFALLGAFLAALFALRVVSKEDLARVRRFRLHDRCLWRNPTACRPRLGP